MTSAPPNDPQHLPTRTTVFPWWSMLVLAGAILCVILFKAATSELGDGLAASGSLQWWLITAAFHLPFVAILFFLVGGLIERIGFFWRGRQPELAGRLPDDYPTVCVQLPMFNEHEVARRVIEAASAMTWPRDRFSVQVLDDSTDEDTRQLVDDVCRRIRQTTGVACGVRRRTDRTGYKAGALEQGRLATDAEFLVLFDADFVPPADFLLRSIPHFYDTSGKPDTQLAMVQAQWGHLNHDQSPLTRAQSLWVDDHHTLQMSWRSAAWGFVNFTGTAGVWRASAVESVGGWRAASLVEDCELSFRHLFAGYRMKFVKEIVAPAELPATFTAYKAQQKRWTQGWVQLQRMHLATLLFRFRCSWPRRVHLAYHMCISWQWPAWAIWITALPFMIYSGHSLASFGIRWGVAVYLLPSVAWLVASTVLASMETKHTYEEQLNPTTMKRRLRRLIPYVFINTGMLPHQLSAFTEGLFGALHSEFERTPKAASSGSPMSAAIAEQAMFGETGRADSRSSVMVLATAPSVVAPRTYHVKIHWPYVMVEAFYVLYQFGWAALFVVNGMTLPALGAAYMAGCVLYLAYFYGDHVGKACFVFKRRGNP